MRVAVIDVGSLTFHAVVADVDEYGVRRTLLDGKTYDRSASALAKLVEKALARTPTAVRVIATNASALADEVCARYGLVVEHLTGEDQAQLSWLGVSTELAC